MAETESYLYDLEGPWPQPNPARPYGEAPAVINIPGSEKRDFTANIGVRYLFNLFGSIPGALRGAREHAITEPISDEAFEAMMTRGVYTKFFADLDPEDVSAFAEFLPPGHDSDAYRKTDLSAIRGVRPYDGMYVAPTVTLFRREGPRAWSVVAIRVGDIVVGPAHRNAYDLAKIFVLQGAAYGTLFTEHPNLHFPFDAINAITKSALPETHPIFQLLAPHLRFSLVLNDSVQFSPGSVITNFPATFYAPFTARMKDGLLDLFVAGYRGIPGNSGYPSYSFDARPRDNDTAYSQFQRRYYEAILEFTTKVAAKIPVGDEPTAYWAKHIHPWVTGFPTATSIFSELPETLARIIWDVSVGHATDHEDFAERISPEQKFIRIRVPPPASRDIPPVDFSKVATFFDRARLRIAHRTFFEVHTITPLVDVEYAFADPELRAANEDFRRDLREVDGSFSAEERFIPLEKISASIQF